MGSSIESTPPLESESDRLDALYGYNIINNYESSGTFQHVVGMAAHIFKVPIALVNFVDEKSVIAESSIGLDGTVEFERETTICSQVVLRDNVTVFKNARMEPCLAANPFVCGDFGLQFYAAAPLKTKDSYKIGVVAIIDQKPRAFTKEDEQILESLAAIVMEELEERRSRA